MGHRPRRDAPGAFFHVDNRGIAGRPIFEGADDIRYFESRLARAVRRGLIEVLAFTVLLTHFHLLLRSPAGRLSEAMQWIENQYARRYNRKRKRDGPLLRGRFWSNRADGSAYRRAIVRYLDHNAVAAGVVEDGATYPFGSRILYAGESGPIWLARAWVESRAAEAAGAPSYRPEHYERAFPAKNAARLKDLVERRLRYAGEDEDPTDDLWDAAPERIREWMRKRSWNADRSDPGVPIVAPQDVLAVVAAARARRPDWELRRRRARHPAWLPATVALLRDVAGATFTECAALLDLSSRAHLRREYEAHATALSSDPGYAEELAHLARTAIRVGLGDEEPPAPASNPPPPGRRDEVRICSGTEWTLEGA